MTSYNVFNYQACVPCDVFSHVMECTLVCSAISDVRYSQLLLFFALLDRMTIRVSVYKAIFCSSRSLDGISRDISVNLWVKRAMIFRH